VHAALPLELTHASDRSEMPIIFITGHADVSKTIQAMKGGIRGLLGSRPLRSKVGPGARLSFKLGEEKKMTRSKLRR